MQIHAESQGIWTAHNKLFPSIFEDGNGVHLCKDLNEDEQSLINTIINFAKVDGINFKKKRVKITISEHEHYFNEDEKRNMSDHFTLTLTQGNKSYSCHVSQIERDGVYEIY